LQDNQIIKALPGNIDAEVINKVMIPKIIQVKYPDLTTSEIEEISQYVVVDSAIKNAQIQESGDKKFIIMSGRFVNIDDLHIDLINSINPFQKAFEILSKSVTSKVFRLIQEAIEIGRIKMSFDEALILWPKINIFVKNNGKHPDINATDPIERRLAEALICIRQQQKKEGVFKQ